MNAIQLIDTNLDDAQSVLWDSLLKAESEINQAWLKEGIALKNIRDNQLYELRGYTSFVSYYQTHLNYHKTTVSLRISSAETALKVRIDNEKYNPAQSVFRELTSVPDKDKQDVIDRACELSVAGGDTRLMAKHITQARIEHEGGYSPEVIAVAETYGYSNDIDKLNITQRWYDKGKDNTDGKFWSLAGSGVIDPADDKPAIEFATASIEDIASVEKRWQFSKMQSDNPNPPIEGMVNSANLILDGQDFTPDAGIVNGINLVIDGMKVKLPIVGKKVKIIIKVME